jgi:hypothetical protein
MCQEVRTHNQVLEVASGSADRNRGVFSRSGALIRTSISNPLLQLLDKLAQVFYNIFDAGRPFLPVFSFVPRFFRETWDLYRLSFLFTNNELRITNNH